MNDNSLTISIPEACALLGISERTGYDLARRGEFPVRVLKLGRCRRVSRKSVIDYIDPPVHGQPQPRVT